MTYYDLLQIRPDASDELIRAAYRRLAKQYHPDTNPLDRSHASARFRLIQDAYEHLRDPSTRRLYDQQLKMQQWCAPTPAQNDNATNTDMTDMFSSARRTLERLMRLMATTRDIPLANTTDERHGR